MLTRCGADGSDRGCGIRGPLKTAISLAQTGNTIDADCHLDAKWQHSSTSKYIILYGYLEFWYSICEHVAPLN